MSLSVTEMKEKSSAEPAPSAEPSAQHKGLAEANDKTRNPKIAWLDVFVTNASSDVSGFLSRAVVQEQLVELNIDFGVLFGKVCFEENMDFAKFFIGA